MGKKCCTNCPLTCINNDRKDLLQSLINKIYSIFILTEKIKMVDTSYENKLINFKLNYINYKMIKETFIAANENSLNTS